MILRTVWYPRLQDKTREWSQFNKEKNKTTTTTTTTKHFSDNSVRTTDPILWNSLVMKSKLLSNSEISSRKPLSQIMNSVILLSIVFWFVSLSCFGFVMWLFGCFVTFCPFQGKTIHRPHWPSWRFLHILFLWYLMFLLVCMYFYTEIIKIELN